MTVFVFHEPSQLSTLQDNGLPGVVLNSLLMKNVSNISIQVVIDVVLLDPSYSRGVGCCTKYLKCTVPQCQRTADLY